MSLFAKAKSNDEQGESLTAGLKNSLDNIWNCLYCILLALWSTIMYEMWKRKEHEIAHLWNMKDYIGNDSERPDYKSEYIIDPKTKDY